MINNSNNFFDFSIFKFKNELLKIIKEIGYSKPTPIQMKCIPLFFKKTNILGVAETGSGKTASFVLPILNSISYNSNLLQALVLVPTRELAIQITNSFIIFNKYLNHKILPLYGGQKYNIQIYGLKKKPNVIVSTPGRLIDCLNRNYLNLNNIKYLVLDEVDEMLRVGFINDVKKILNFIKNKYHTSLFSATISSSIKKIVNKFKIFPKEINLSFRNNKKDILPRNIKQYYCIINIYKDKLNFLMKFLEVEKFIAVIIFVRTKNYTLKLSNILIEKGYSCSALNGDMNQNLREKTIWNLRNNKISILIATDIASRGLDINNINLVINYDIPMDVKSYIHRIGRTGRAGNSGKTILFLEKKELFFLNLLRKNISVSIKKIFPPTNKIILNKRINNIISKILLYKKKKNIVNNFYRKIIDIINNKIKFKDKNYLNIILLKLFYDNLFNKKIY